MSAAVHRPPASALNALGESLKELCAAEVLAEKWLLVPTLRVGFQWLDAVTLSGQPVLGVRPITVRSMARELAGPELERRGLSTLRGRQAELLVEQLFCELRDRGDGYLSPLNPGPGLIRTLLAAIRDLRLSGLSAARLKQGAFEVPVKGQEIRGLLEAYEGRLRRHRLADHATVLGLAIERLRAGPAALPRDVLFLAPDDLELEGLEGDMWREIPTRSRRRLEVDRPGVIGPGAAATDAGLLSFLSCPDGAPAPPGDGSARLFRAVGEVNEVREVLRRCGREGLPLDQVEILHTDAETYVPLVFELTARLTIDAAGPPMVTFAEGLPLRYFLPGKALQGWQQWMAEGYPQAILVQMIQDGLLRLPAAEAAAVSFHRLGAILRCVRIGAGAERYVPALEQEISRLERGPGRAGEEPAARRAQERLTGLRAILELVRRLLDLAPEAGASQREIIGLAERFLLDHVRRRGQLDEYSHHKLLREVRDLGRTLEELDAELEGLDVQEWLSDLPMEARVGGEGPRPGRLHVASVQGGGHSGRPVTFVLGLDDGRFPGGGLQDPLLLDRERVRLSSRLPTSGSRMAKKVAGLERTLARLRGQVTLSYSGRNLTADRAQFPAGVLLSAYRALTGDPGGDQDALLEYLGPPASFAPGDEASCHAEAEWWLWRMCAGDATIDLDRALEQSFPHLARGRRAGHDRASDRFTAHDGNVPRAGAVCDPRRPDGPVLSATRLETLGACPMIFFFRHVLQIEPPPEYELDRTRWLDPLARGSLLHRVFYRFMLRLHNGGLRPDFSRDAAALAEILDDEVARRARHHPPSSRDLFVREQAELRLCARIFLQEEEAFCRESEPFGFEVAVGVPSEDTPSELDIDEPVALSLPSGDQIRARGMIDRLDRVPGSRGERFTIWDYKTGSSYKYKPDDPFRQGRVIQNALYLRLGEERLRRRVSPAARVSRFGYFFPDPREHGDRISWSADQLRAGPGVLQRLCEMMAAGCFPCSDEVDDLKFSAYLPLIGDARVAAAAARRKLGNPDNAALRPFAALRGYEGGR